VKQRKTVRPRRLRRTIPRIQASADEGEGPLTQWRGYRKQNKKQIGLYLDADVLAWFKREGRGYQTRINLALWKMMKDEKKASSGRA
jgi:uncharacterized protein (DUF4415 family)